ncbi:MAG TPA: hypothetical protein DIS90_05815 [Cytophagales bacterium]|nr:hypothetical protein [Cytophagales bacterium]
MGCTAGTYAEWSAKILFGITVIVGATFNKSDSYFPLIRTCFLIAARINRQKEEIACNDEANQFHGSKIG